MAAQLLERGRGKRLLGLQVVLGAEGKMGEVEREAADVGGEAERLDRLLRHLGSDSVAGQDRDPVALSHGRRLPFGSA